MVRLNNRLGGLFLSQFGGLFSPLSAVAGWSKRKNSLNSFDLGKKSAIYCFVFSNVINFLMVSPVAAAVVPSEVDRAAA